MCSLCFQMLHRPRMPSTFQQIPLWRRRNFVQMSQSGRSLQTILNQQVLGLPMTSFPDTQTAVRFSVVNQTPMLYIAPHHQTHVGFTVLHQKLIEYTAHLYTTDISHHLPHHLQRCTTPYSATYQSVKPTTQCIDMDTRSL